MTAARTTAEKLADLGERTRIAMDPGSEPVIIAERHNRISRLPMMEQIRATRAVKDLVAGALAAAPARLDELRERPGYGVEARWNGETVRLGRADWAGTGEDAQGAASWLRIGERVWRIDFADSLRPGAAATIASLRKQGLRVMMLSGDAAGAAGAIAAINSIGNGKITYVKGGRTYNLPILNGR